jgi:uncharacterized Fe-S cluster protein YjdI/CDGSH-type Zn-finger protein
MNQTKQKEYTHDGFTIIWKPEKCIHSGVCVKKLPKVYHPKEKPWITMENATEEELRAQIDACPSGALSYKGESSDHQSKLAIELMKDGPLMVKGHCVFTDKNGEKKTLSGTNAFCRCGASSNKPFCDGSHAKIDFKDDESNS